ncbi:MAG TPA: hypothetical protein VFU02_04325, partial [Polyangiaceae bacterium]|nr:hypothetical protein [Polyangiaceae bacterium]
PFALCTMALALVRLASWDPRVNLGPYTISYVLLAVFVVLATWLSALLAHRRLNYLPRLQTAASSPPAADLERA